MENELKKLAERSSLQMWQAYCDKKMECEDLQEQVETQAARIAELESREPRFIWTGTEVDDAMILIDRMDDSLEPERIAQLEQILPRLGARIAELEAQTAHMADLVELANNATERADKLEAQVKQLQRVPLSDGEIKNIIAGLEHSPWLNPHGFARAIEAAHNIK